MSHVSIPLRIATLGGLGKSPFAPGTIATGVAGIPSALFMGLFPLPWASIFLTFTFFLGCYVSERAERELRRTDPGEVVIDELVGFLVTVIALPLTLKSMLLGFAAFRLFDIWKPWPIWILQERLKGGLGVVMDDVGAGIYAHLLVWTVLRIWE